MEAPRGDDADAASPRRARPLLVVRGDPGLDERAQLDRIDRAAVIDVDLGEVLGERLALGLGGRDLAALVEIVGAHHFGDVDVDGRGLVVDGGPLGPALLFVRLAGRVGQLVGFDLAGPELGYPPSLHAVALERVRGNLGITLHAGEADGLDSIVGALESELSELRPFDEESTVRTASRVIATSAGRARSP